MNNFESYFNCLRDISKILKEFLIFYFSKPNFFREVDFGKGGSDISNEHSNGEKA